VVKDEAGESQLFCVWVKICKERLAQLATFAEGDIISFKY
jgi:hypothetical protein